MANEKLFSPTFRDAWASLTDRQAESYDEGLNRMSEKTAALVKYVMDNFTGWNEPMVHDDECIQNCTEIHGKCRAAHGCWCTAVLPEAKI